ncbi:MAG TPA: P-loop NTPase fold protein, partial [Candidatus Angelobacter sp.]|nr:P-loop NTPase fold protein [Candidatus Angelobacter sp.]
MPAASHAYISISDGARAYTKTVEQACLSQHVLLTQALDSADYYLLIYGRANEPTQLSVFLTAGLNQARGTRLQPMVFIHESAEGTAHSLFGSEILLIPYANESDLFSKISDILADRTQTTPTNDDAKKADSPGSIPALKLFSPATLQSIRFALAYAEKASAKKPYNSQVILNGMILCGRDTRIDAPHFLFKYLIEHDESESLRLLGFDSKILHGPTRGPGRLIPPNLYSGEVRNLFKEAARIAVATNSKANEIYPRHLLAALLIGAHSGSSFTAQRALINAGYNFKHLLSAFWVFLTQNPMEFEKPNSWDVLKHLTEPPTTSNKSQRPADSPKSSNDKSTELPPDQVNSLSELQFTERCLRVLTAAAGYTRNRRKPDGYSLNTTSILFALADLSLGEELEPDDATRIFGPLVRQSGLSEYQDMRARYLKENLPGGLPPTIFSNEPLHLAFGRFTRAVFNTISRAEAIATRTASSAQERVDTRHLIGALLTTDLDREETSMRKGLLGIDSLALQDALYSLLEQYFSSTDFHDEWVQILGMSPSSVMRVSASDSEESSKSPEGSHAELGKTLGAILSGIASDPEEASPPSNPDVAPVPGYVSDSIPGANENLTDELGIDKDVKTLCSVLLAREVKPPLAVGLFGDWGTGKSYFMEKMYREIYDLADRTANAEKAHLAVSAQGGATDEIPSKTTYHSSVIQIRFNAWHYADSNLWASLVSHIFDELFGQICPTETSEDTRRRLVLELETAKQARIDAEAAQKRAEAERSNAEESLKSAREEREKKQIELKHLRIPDLLEVLSDGQQAELKADLTKLLDGLGLPHALDSIRELNEVCRSAFTLPGRFQAALFSLWNSTSRTTVIVLLAAAFLLVPLIGWLVEHVLRAPSIAAVTAFLGEVTVALSGFAAVFKKNLTKVSGFLKDLESKRD